MATISASAIPSTKCTLIRGTRCAIASKNAYFIISGKGKAAAVKHPFWNMETDRKSLFLLARENLCQALCHQKR